MFKLAGWYFLGWHHLQECLALLARNGYILIEGKCDTLAFLKPGRLNAQIYIRIFRNMLLQILTKVWHRLKAFP